MRFPRPRRVQQDAGSHPAMDYRLPPTLAILRQAAIIAAVLAVVAGAWSVYWLVLATSLRDGVIAWAEQRRAEGLDVGFANLDVVGYPGSVRAVIDRLTAGSSDGTWSWSADRAELTLNPLAPKHFTVAIAGGQAIALRTESGRIAYTGTVQTFTAEMVDDDAEPSGTLSVRDLRMTEVGGSETITVGNLDADAKGFASSPDAAGAPTVEIGVSLAGVQLPERLALPLGQRVTAAAIDAKLIGALEPGPLPDALARWRDAGGTVEVARLDVEYGPLDLKANGTLALDGDNQPIGAFTTRIQGFFQAVDALRRRRLVDDRAAITAKLVLGALARKGSNGERPTLSIPLTLQDRLLYAGPVPLFEIPPISWTTDP